MMHIFVGFTLGAIALALGCLWLGTGRPRPNGDQYALIPPTFGWFAATLSLIAFNWPLVQSGWLGGYDWLLIAALILTAVLIVWNRVSVWVATSVIAIVAGMVLGPIAPAAAAAIGALGTPAVPASSSPSPAVEPTIAPATQVATTPADVPSTYPDRYLELLRKHGYTTESVDGQTIPVFVAKSTKYKEKLWMDAVCLPVKDREAVLAMVLGSPDCAAQVASGLYRLPVLGLDGKTKQLGDISPWLSQFADPSGLNDWAQAAMEAKGADRIEYARKLVLIAVQLERFTDGGVDKRETAYNFHAVVDRKGGTLSVDESNPEGAIPEFELSPKQYRGDFVVFRVTYKGFDGCWAEFGINIGDGRFAGFTCEKPKPTEKPSPNPTTDKPNPEPSKPGPGPSTPPTTAPSEPTKTPTPTPTPTPSLDKPDENNPTPPPAVTPTTQPRPTDSASPTPRDPIVPTERPGSPIKSVSPRPTVTVPDNEDRNRPTSPPTTDRDNTPREDDPGREISDPDATNRQVASLGWPAAVLLVAALWRLLVGRHRV